MSNSRFWFDRIGPFYHWLTANSLWRESVREMARHLPPSAATLRLLDVGCGPGNSAAQLLKFRPDLQITGVDLSAGILNMARQSRITANWVQADMGRLPLHDNSFDAITGHSVYYMLDSQQAALFLSEVMRVLRPGGRLILLDPLARGFPFEFIPRIFRQPRLALSVLFWHAVSRFYRRFTLDNMAQELTEAGFARILTERTVEGCAVLSRGEKPYEKISTIERINQTADIIDAAQLPERGRFIFVLVRQIPDKPVWALKPDEPLRWEAVMITDQGKPTLLAFSSLPKAVQFMQPAVTAGSLVGVNKVAKFEKTVASRWGVDFLLNPPFESITFSEMVLNVDPKTAVTGDE